MKVLVLKEKEIRSLITPAAALEASRAWNKLLLVHLNALLLGYLGPGQPA